MEKSISLGRQHFQEGFKPFEGVDEGKPPMPTGGMQAIAAICGQAADLMKAAASYRPAGLANVVEGRNVAVLSAANQIKSNNVGELAAFAKALEGSRETPQGPEKPSVEAKLQPPPQQPATPDAKPRAEGPKPIQMEPVVIMGENNQKPTIELPPVKIEGKA